MLTATGEIPVTDILPTDYESLVRGIARQHQLEVTELYRIPGGLFITLAALWNDGQQFTTAITSVFTALQNEFSPSPKKVGRVRTEPSSPTPSDLAKYDAESQPWYPKKPISSKELPPTQIPTVRELIDIVLLVATEVELAAVLEVLQPLKDKTAILRVHGVKASYYVGRIGEANTAVGLSSMGSVGRDAAITTTTRAITTWHPRAVIMAGIAFGLKPDKQQIGDVLVSEKITPYEPQRIGKTKIQRGSPALAGKTLLARFKAIREWRFNRPDGGVCKKILGEVISGEKLVDDKRFRDGLAKRFPDAVGGEMEGVGLYAGAADAEVEWIAVKAICDWGMGKSSTHQPLAAAAAVSLVLQVLQDASSLHGLNKVQLEADVAAPSPIRITNTAATGIPGQEELYRDRDRRTILRLLRNLPLRFLTQFMESAHVDRVLNDVFHFWEGFNAEVIARDFQLFDKELLNAVSKIHQAWGRSLGHGEYFLSTANPDVYRYRNLLPGESHDDFDRHYKQYRQDVADAEHALDEFVNQVKLKFPDIDLYETSREAMQLFEEWMGRFESRHATTSKDQRGGRAQKNARKATSPKRKSKNSSKSQSPLPPSKKAAKVTAKRRRKKSP